MALKAETLVWMSIAVGVAAVLITAALWLARVHLVRRHRALITESLERMCGMCPGVKPRLRSLGAEVVELLRRQDQAARLGGFACPSADTAMLVSIDVATTVVPALWEEAPDDRCWATGTVAPRVVDHPDLRSAVESIVDGTHQLVIFGRVVLAHGLPFDLPEPDCRERLHASLENAERAVVNAQRRADDGDLLGALELLTDTEVPVPEDGFPGQAVADELRVQVNTLARLALRHQAALTGHLAARPVREEP